MTLVFTTFTPLTEGTRDLTEQPGSIYILDGNSNNGRINTHRDTTLKFGNDTTILIEGNTNHSYNNGRIEATRLKYILKPDSGRADYGSSPSTYILKDVTFVALGSGQVFHHLQSSDNVFSGFFKMVANMTSGTLYLQFGAVEVPSFALDIAPTNNATITFYPARLSNGFTPFPNITFNGLTADQTIEILKGTKTDAHGRFYDPQYRLQNGSLLENNLVRLRVDTNNAANNLHEYFTLDVTNIRNDDTKILVTDSAGNTQYDSMLLTESNCTIYATNGTTSLKYYRDDNRWVIPCLVRRVGSSVSFSRNTISYKIRRLGYIDIVATDIEMNGPISISEHLVDETYGNTGDISIIATAQQMYDEIKKYLFNHLTVDITMSISEDTISFTNNIIFDPNNSELVSLSGNDITIKSSSLEGNVTTTGTVTLLNGATVSGGIIDSNGDSFVVFEDVDYWYIYATSDDSENNKNIISQGSGSDNYRFVFSSSETTKHMRTVSSGRINIFSITVTKGSNTITGDLNAKLATIEESTNLVLENIDSTYLTVG